MEEKARLLKLRKEIKKRKPTFIQQCAHKIKSLSFRWRKPKGIQSKMRLSIKGKRNSPSLGYSSPSKVKGLSKEGLKVVRVLRSSEIDLLNKEENVIVVGKIGQRKKVAVLEKCKKLGFKVVNVKNIQKNIERIQKDMDSRKKNRKGYEEGRKKLDDASKKKKEEKKIDQEDSKKEAEVTKEETKKDSEVPKEETKKGDKSDKIKVLEKRQ
jgi:large subunit ribosomal protein L32e